MLQLEIVENTCPYCDEVLHVNKKTFANHVRWCKKNPKYEEIRAKTIQNITKSLKKISTKKEHTIKCCVCGENFAVNITDNCFNGGKYRKTCSDSCAKKLTLLNTDMEVKNKKVSESVKQKLRDNNKIIISETKFVCKYCGKEFVSDRSSRIFCSQQCARKYRRQHEIANKSEKDIYKTQTKFNFSLNSYPNEFDFSLIKENGWYKASNHGDNLRGISRDHMFSVDEGYKQNIDPYLISHPANCKLMKHEDNFKKKTGCSITLDELKERIIAWNGKYGIYPNKIDYTKIEKFRT